MTDAPVRPVPPFLHAHPDTVKVGLSLSRTNNSDCGIIFKDSHLCGGGGSLSVQEFQVFLEEEHKGSGGDPHYHNSSVYLQTDKRRL